jgi:hypothetical protein
MRDEYPFCPFYRFYVYDVHPAAAALPLAVAVAVD